MTITYTVNVPAGMAAGTYENTARARFDSNLSGALDAGDTYVDDAGNTAQDADTPVGQDPESDEDVTITAAAHGDHQERVVHHRRRHRRPGRSGRRPPVHDGA